MYNDSAYTFVATFLGSPGMNLLQRNGFLLGFRAENFLPREAMPLEEDPAVIDLHVRRIEYLGADRLIYGVAKDGPEDVILIAKLPSLVSMPIEVDETHPFSIARENLRFFDAETGKRTDPQPM